MKKGTIGKWIAGMGICLVLGGSIYSYYQPKTETLDLTTLVDQLNSERKAEVEQPIKYNLMDFEKESEGNTFTEEELEELFKGGARRLVTKEEAIEDIDIFFKVLKEGYGGYIHFGGQERFEQAKQEMIAKVESVVEERITTVQFEQILREGIAFIEDSHFWINDKPLYFDEQYCYYGSEIGDIEKDSKGYYILEQNKKAYIDEFFEAYIKPTINEAGKLVYGLFAIATEEEKEELPTTIGLKRGMKSNSQEIEWKLCQVRDSQLEAGCQYYSYTENSGIPVITCKAMVNDYESIDFLEKGLTVRDKKVGILDLRGNGGGDMLEGFKWLYQVTGKTIYPKQIVVVYKNQIQSYSNKFSMKGAVTSGSRGNGRTTLSNQEELYAAYQAYQKCIVEEDQWQIQNHAQEEKWNENETLWFVLVNKNVGSAAEIVLRQMETMSNVIIVGTNSNGCLVTGGVLRDLPIYLPNSKNQIIYGTKLIIANDMEGYDERGTLPDIYIADENVLDAVVRCYQYYNEA